jgi:pilus assembly protein Flp/PilA
MSLVRFKSLCTSLRADTRGANMVEYIILVGVVAILAMAGFKYFGKNVNNTISLQAHTVSEVQSQ